MIRNCFNCGKELSEKKSNAPWKTVFCDRACKTDYQRSKCVKPGYLEGKTVNGQRTYLHREIIERLIGRPLRSNEIVHHIDEDKTNNNPENLEIVTKSEHGLIHSSVNAWFEEASLLAKEGLTIPEIALKMEKSRKQIWNALKTRGISVRRAPNSVRKPIKIDFKELVSLFNKGFSLRSLERRFGVPRGRLSYEIRRIMDEEDHRNR